MNPDLSASHNVMMKLIEGLLNDGIILHADNFFMSVPLARHLLQYKTHLVRKCLSLEVIKAKLKKRQITKESPVKITVLKWQYNRAVKMLSIYQKGNETEVVTNSCQNRR